LCSPGMKLHGSGFIVAMSEAKRLGLGSREGLDQHICVHRNGRDLTDTPRNLMVIDFFGLELEEVRTRFPEAYQHLAETVRAQRDSQALRSNTKDARDYARKWWLFGKPREELRPALRGLSRYIATVETAKHRVFQLLDGTVLPDNMLIAIASDDAFHLGVLSSQTHVEWALQAGGTLEDRPRYSKSVCFDPFPFPDPDERQKAEIADIAEKLDAHRKAVQAAHPDITLTEMYNVLEKQRATAPGPRLVGINKEAVAQPRRGRKASGTTLSPREEDIKTRGLVLVLKDYHDALDALDAAVARAYGWPADLSDEEILTRLVALNAERAAEEAAGQVRWLRPDYQIPRFGTAAQKADRTELDLVAPGETKKPSSPTEEVRRTSAIYAVLADLRYGDLASSDGGRTFTLRRAA